MAVSSKVGRRDMKLTQSTRLLQHQQQPTDSFPTKQLFFLAICRVAEPIALTSIFPYSWLMVKGFHVGDSNDASFYAGVLISAFALSECLTGMFWGSLSDRVGRKPVLLLGCAGTMLSLLVVGFAQNFWVALAGRVLGGILNGNIGVIQTMVGELVTKPEHEPRAYSVMPFVWSIGTIIGPAIGGTLADPSNQFPKSFSSSGLFGHFPYLLPNLVCAALLLISMGLGWFFLEETHALLKLGLSVSDLKDSSSTKPLVISTRGHGEVEINLRAESYGTFDISDFEDSDSWISQEIDIMTEKPIAKKQESPKIMTFKIIMLLVALGIFTYHSMSFDHLLPIFLQDSAEETTAAIRSALPPGLGLSTFDVGTILSVSGASALFIQAVVFPLMASWMTPARLLLLVTLLHPLVYFPMPFLAMLPSNLIYPGIYAMSAFRNFTAIIAYPLLLIMINQTCPCPTILGKVNGLAASVAAACRTVSPPLAGVLYACGLDIGFAGLAWWGSGFVAIVGAMQIYFVKRDKVSSKPVVYEACPTEDIVIEDEDNFRDDISVAVLRLEGEDV